MKVLRKISLIVLNSFEGTWNKKRNLNAKLIQLVFILTLMFTLSVSLTSYASIDNDLIKASYHGDVLTVKALLNKGADVNAMGNGVTALFFASQNGHIDVVKVLLENGANVNARLSDDMTALLIASGKGHTDVVKVLLEKDANVNAKRSDDMTALILASQNRHIDVVKVLLEKGANVNAKNNDGATPLHFAVAKGQKEMAELLLSKGADVNAKNNQGGTPLDTTEYYGHQDVLDLLMQSPEVDLTTVANFRYKTEIKIRNLFSDVKVIILKPDTESNGAPKPLVDAAFSGNIERLFKLLKLGKNPNSKGQWEVSALFLASYKGHKDVVRALIEAGADINAKLVDSKNDSIKVATYEGHIEVVRLFLEAGVSPFATGVLYENNAAFIAEIRGHTDIVNLFNQYK